MVLGPHRTYSFGGYKGNEDEGRAKQAAMGGAKILEDFVAAA